MNKNAEATTKVSKNEEETDEALALRLLNILKTDRKKKKMEPSIAKEKEVDGDAIKEFKATVHAPKGDVKLKLVRTLKDGGTNPTQKLFVVVGETEIKPFQGYLARKAYDIFTKDNSKYSSSRKSVRDVSETELLKSLF